MRLPTPVFAKQQRSTLGGRNHNIETNISQSSCVTERTGDNGFDGHHHGHGSLYNDSGSPTNNDHFNGSSGFGNLNTAAFANPGGLGG